jgi:exodeoxyribonuclease VII large subunit
MNHLSHIWSVSQQLNSRKVFTLLEVTRSIQKTLSERYQSSFWVKAEMNKLNFYRHSGHCYPELVEKQDGKIVAQMKGNLWHDDYIRVDADFQRVLKEPLKDGVKILILARIEYHPEYGLSLRILDIDPSYTLGDLEREKRETIEKLQAEGVLARNKELTMAVLPQRIAIISVETSKGYADFLKVLQGASKTWGYAFFQMLFPSVLQGDNAVTAIMFQLDRIRKVISHFDAVAIVRGGGGDIGLSCYNNYNLAREIALFPIPVITGIGHATNETVAELVAFENAITPTKLAEFLIQKFHNFSVPVKEAQRSIVDNATRLTREVGSQFTSELKLLRSAVRNAVTSHKGVLRSQAATLLQQTRFLVAREKTSIALIPLNLKKNSARMWTLKHQEIAVISSQLDKELALKLTAEGKALWSIEQGVNNLSPQAVLKRGFSITKRNGKSIKSAREIAAGETIETQLFEGTIHSVVNSTDEHHGE